MPALRVLVVDDSSLFRSAATTLLGLDERMEVVGSADSSAAALEFVARHQVDVVLLDVNLPDRSGIETAAELGSHYPAMTVVLCSTMAGTELGLSQDLADAFIPKDELAPELLVERWRRHRN